MVDFYKKYILYNLPCHILTFVSVCLIIASFIVKPLGVIDPSVLAAVGEVFAFSALYTILKAIDKGGVSAKVRHHDTTVEIRHDDTPVEKKKHEEPVIKTHRRE